MKKRTRPQPTPREPSKASLRDVPPVDFAKYKAGRRNPFAKRMKAEGWELEHDGPSAASLREMPEIVDWSKARRNPYAKRLNAAGYD
ncbi:MAG: hypothetical protein ACRELY_31235, partial [Polyangiaceae bacterium]